MNDQTPGPLENIFHKLAKLTIIVPIVIVAVAFVLRESPRGSNANNNRFRNLNTQPRAVSSPTTLPQAPRDRLEFSSNVKLNLTGPMVCNYSTAEMTATASIKDKKIFAEIQRAGSTEAVLVRDDCIYRWQKGTTTGEKTCGIGPVMTMVESLAQFNLISMDTVLNSLSQLNVESSITPPSAESLAKACQTKEVAEAVFAMPAEVKFQDSGKKISL